MHDTAAEKAILDILVWTGTGLVRELSLAYSGTDEQCWAAKGHWLEAASEEPQKRLRLYPQPFLL